MSFTLIRTKNGEQIPIKVSVFDAFRSRAHTSRPILSANGAGVGVNGHFDRRLLLITTRNLKQSRTPATSAPAAAAAAAAGKKSSNPHTGGADEVWTAKDDARLVALKNEGKTWAQILEALGDGHSSKSGAQTRFKELTTGGGEAKKTEDEKKAKEEGLKKKGEGQKGKGKGRDGGTQKGKGKTSTSNDLKNLADKYDKEKWLVMASRHFDRTGQRISPEMAKQMCEKKG